MQASLDPKNDVVFKMILTTGSIRPLRSLLTAVLQPTEPMVSLDILNPELPKQIVGDRGLFLDVHVKLANGEYVNVEMQMAQHQSQWARMHFHWARLYAQQILAGDKFDKFCPSSVIFFNNFGKFSTSPKDFHLSFRVRELLERIKVPDYMKLELIQLKHVLNLPIEPTGSNQHTDLLLDWSRFLIDPNHPQWRSKIMKNQDIAEADELLQKLSQDRATRELARQREFGELDLKLMRNEAMKEGKERGIEIGKERGIEIGQLQGRMESARRLHKMGLLPPDEIATLLDLSVEDLKIWLNGDGHT